MVKETPVVTFPHCKSKLKMLEDYHLRWNEFERNTANSFAKLRNEKTFFDVTLVSNDQKQISAHKLILSACSDTFRTIFSNNFTSNLVLYLDGLDSTEVNLMLDYIYQGEVNVYQERLDRFIQIAEKFKLDGLLSSTTGNQISPKTEFVKTESVEVKHDPDVNVNEGSKIMETEKDFARNVAFVEEMQKEIDGAKSETLVEDPDSPSVSVDNKQRVNEQDKERETRFEDTITEIESDMEDINYEVLEEDIPDRIKMIMNMKIEPLVPKIECSNADFEEDITDRTKTIMNMKSEPLVPKIECSNADFERIFQEKVLKEENFWLCTVCERTMKQRIDIKRHFENHVSGLSFDCTMCEKTFLTSQALTAHRRKNHKTEIRKYNLKNST